MKRFYFVRHGESKGNLPGAILQHEHTPLTEKGHFQAALIGKRLKDIPIDCIIASTMHRAQQTAHIIAQEIAWEGPIQSSPLLIERARPSACYGKIKEDPEVVSIEESIVQHWHQSDWHHSNEENFFDLKTRAQAALSLLAETEGTHTLVVTHGMFIRILLGTILFGDAFGSHESVPLILGTHTTNTGITIADYRPGKDGIYRWILLTFNNYAHLPA